MKIATNVHRDVFGGITVSNLALFDWLEDKEDIIIGIELIIERYLRSARVFMRYQPDFFRHHIINCLDVVSRYPWGKSLFLETRWRVLIEETKKVLRDENPDVVLVNGTYFSPWILSKAAQELGIPVVLRYAGVLKREARHRGFFERRRLLSYERWVASNANACIFPSQLCRDVVEREVLGGGAARSIIIPNPVSLEGIRKRSLKKDGRYTIAAIGRWTPIKNFESFVAVHEALLEKMWSHRAIMVTSYRGGKMRIPETIERKDPMSQTDLRAFYRSIDLLVVPSHFETFCNVAAEALIHGAQVLVSEQVGFSEVLRKAGLGRMVIKSFDDPAVVARAVMRLSKTKLTDRERAVVAHHLDSHRIHQSIISVLRDVVDGRES